MIKLNNPQINNALEVLTKAQVSLKNIVAEEQCNCKHSNIAECEYLSFSFLDSQPPIRICLDCGLAEEGWNCGYIILKSEMVYKIGRDKLYNLRQGKLISSNNKTKLLLKEVSLEEFLSS